MEMRPWTMLQMIEVSACQHELRQIRGAEVGSPFIYVASSFELHGPDVSHAKRAALVLPRDTE
eukprot:scaffold250894_cov17-Tisochrysis_lutea.AAC.1